LRRRPARGLNCAIHEFWILCVADAAKKNCARHLPVGLASGEFRESAARTNHGIEQTSRCKAITKIEAVAEHALDAEMIGERAHDVVESLAYQHDIGTGGYDFLELGNPSGFQSWLEEILEEFFAEEVEPVAAYAAQHRVQKACGEHAIRGVEKRARDSEDAHGAAAAPAFKKGLGVPGEEADGADGREIEQAAFYAPVDWFSRDV